jgi:hypothetical protein
MNTIEHAFGRMRRSTRLFDQYEDSLPTHQNAVDLVKGWNTAFPPECGVNAGTLPVYADPRIRWAIECFGPIEGRSVLELGPLEAAHTAMLEEVGALVDSIEANKLAFLRCLVTKEIRGMTRAKFYLGDFVKWLETTEKMYDLIVASGVLYHMRDPLHLLELMAARSNALFLWTHYVDDLAMPKGDPRRIVLSEPIELKTNAGVPVRLYQRTYMRAQKNVTFCGGMEDKHYWLHRDDLQAVLKSLGYTNLAIAHEEPDHKFGPSFSIFARRDG